MSMLLCRATAPQQQASRARPRAPGFEPQGPGPGAPGPAPSSAGPGPRLQAHHPHERLKAWPTAQTRLIAPIGRRGPRESGTSTPSSSFSRDLTPSSSSRGHHAQAHDCDRISLDRNRDCDKISLDRNRGVFASRRTCTVPGGGVDRHVTSRVNVHHAQAHYWGRAMLARTQ